MPNCYENNFCTYNPHVDFSKVWLIYLYVYCSKIACFKFFLYLSLLLKVTYIPAEVFTTPGSDVTVYAVFHNRSWSASKAVWMLNGQVKIPESQYSVINEQVSAVTMKVDEPGIDTLMCCHQWGERFKCIIAYAKIYTEGAL